MSKDTCKDPHLFGLFFVSLVEVAWNDFLDVFVVIFFVVAKENIAERSCKVGDVPFVVDYAEDRG